MGKSIIDINGKRYDAHSGELLGKAGSHAQTETKPTRTARNGQVIDGFVKSAYNPSITPKQMLTVPAPLNMKKTSAARNASQASVSRKTEKSKTLMRSAVHKPDIKAQLKPVVKSQAPSELQSATVSTLVPAGKLSAQNVDHQRMARAKRLQQSQYVRRFTTVQQNHPTPLRSAILPVRQQQEVTPSKVQPQPHHAHDIFEAAIENAKSHELPKLAKRNSKKQKIIAIASAFGAVVLLVGFITYLNMSNIEIKIASVRAGFSAQLPSYSPTGYALSGGINAQNGVVATTYKSGDSTYTLQQQTSNWDSQTLYNDVVATSGEKQQTIQSQGRTVYIYGNNAAWVNGGVLYSLKTDGNINADQITAIAASI